MQKATTQPNLRFIDRPAVKSVLNYSDLIPLIENALSKCSQPAQKGGVCQPLRSVIPVDGRGCLLTMPSFSKHDNALAIKLVTNFPNNTDHPSHQGCIVLFDDCTGAPLAILDAEEITGMRTAAVSAVGVKHLRNDLLQNGSAVAAIVGTGYQAECHVIALAVLGCFREIRIAGRSQNSLDNIKQKLPNSLPHGSILKFDTDIQQMVEDADVICTVTSSGEPVIKSDWIRKNSLIIGVGACLPNLMEIDPKLTNRSQVYVDSRLSAQSESGDIILSKVEICGEIGEVINKDIPCPNRDLACPIVFKHLGLAVEDAVSAKLVYEKLKI